MESRYPFGILVMIRNHLAVQVTKKKKKEAHLYFLIGTNLPVDGAFSCGMCTTEPRRSSL
jgi:hypothetical protein